MCGKIINRRTKIQFSGLYELKKKGYISHHDITIGIFFKVRVG